MMLGLFGILGFKTRVAGPILGFKNRVAGALRNNRAHMHIRVIRVVILGLGLRASVGSSTLA